MVSAFVPAAFEIETKNGKSFLNEFYLRGSKYLILVSAPILYFLITNASLIMLAWMGKGYGKAVLVIQILAVGYFANLVSGAASSIAIGVAKTKFEMKYSILIFPRKSGHFEELVVR